MSFFTFSMPIAPIVDADSINMKKAWIADRFDRGAGEGDYINCPLTKVEYYALMEEISKAGKVEAKDFEKDTPFFEVLYAHRRNS